MALKEQANEMNSLLIKTIFVQGKKTLSTKNYFVSLLMNFLFN